MAVEPEDVSQICCRVVSFHLKMLANYFLYLAGIDFGHSGRVTADDLDIVHCWNSGVVNPGLADLVQKM